MTLSEHERAIFSSTIVNVIVPSNTQVPLATALRAEKGEITFSDIQQRDILFFDESLTVYVTLRTPQRPEDELKSYLARLNLRLEIWVSNDASLDERSPVPINASQELIFGTAINQSEDPDALVSQGDKSDDETVYLTLIWEVPVLLNRPRMRSQSCTVTFQPIAFTSSAENPASQDDILEPFRPATENLFEPLGASARYENGVPFLPITRLDGVLPQTAKNDHSHQLETVRPCSIPIHLAFVTRLRLSRISLEDAMVSMLASIDVDLIPYLHIQGQITEVAANLQHGKVDSLTESLLPIDCRSKDCVTFMYRLERGVAVRSGATGLTSTQYDLLTANIVVELVLSDICRPKLHFQWTGDIDFSRHLTQPLTGSASSTYSQSQSKSMGLQPSFQLVESNNISISFTSLSTHAKVGIPFSWQLLVVNKTAKAAKLAIIPIPRVQKPTSQAQHFAKRHATRSSIVSHASSQHIGDRSIGDTAQVVMDENVVYAMQHSGAVPQEIDIMSLTPELRVGPLGPGQCHQSEIRFVAFRSGAFTLDAIRVVDLIREMEQGHGSHGVVVDIRELPDIIVEDHSQ